MATQTIVKLVNHYSPLTSEQEHEVVVNMREWLSARGNISLAVLPMLLWGAMKYLRTLIRTANRIWLKHLWRSLRASFWFLPSLIVAFSTVLALGLIEVYSSGKHDWMTDGQTFASLMAESFDEIRGSADGNVAIMVRMLGALQTIASQTDNPNRRRVLREHMECIAELAERSIKSPHDKDRFENRLAQVCAALKKKPLPGHPYPTTPTEPRTQNKEQVTGSGRVTPHRP